MQKKTKVSRIPKCFFFRQKKKHEKIDKPLPLRQNGRSANKLNEDYTTTTTTTIDFFFSRPAILSIASNLRQNYVCVLLLTKNSPMAMEENGTNFSARFEIDCRLKELLNYAFSFHKVSENAFFWHFHLALSDERFSR